MALQQQKTVNY